jgi:cytochrome c oxidase subunit 2
MSIHSLIPEQASTWAPKLDLMFYTMLAISAFFFFAVIIVVTVFAIKYRKGSKANREMSGHGHNALEIVWTVIPLVLAILIFAWAAVSYFYFDKVPENAQEVYVTGKQWMWKIQHPNGKREINELHVPLGVPMKLTMTSEDVIHSFFVPAFRVKRDVVPGMFTNLWFEATKTGTFHLFCAEYCGTEHSKMIGRVIVMEPEDYERWLEGEDSGGGPVVASAGEQLFARLGCVTCHNEGSGARGPHLAGLFGHEVALADGNTVVADEAYIRESIMDPSAKLTAGYPPLMPTFQGQIKEDDLFTLIDYIKSLEGGEQDGTT